MDLPGTLVSSCTHGQLIIHQLTLGLILEEVVNLGDGSVEGNDVESMVGSVQDQVL